MAFSYSPKIITDGLVFYLDAANPRSYPGVGTTWTDLSRGGNTGTLINGPTFDSGNGGSIVFDGVNDYTSINTILSLQGNSPFSVSGWFKRNGDWSNGATWGIGGGSSTTGINSWNSGNTNQITIDLWGTTTYTTNQTYSLTEWKHVVWVYSGPSFTTSNIIIYINSIPYTGANLTSLRGSTGTPAIAGGVVIGRADVISNQYYGKPTISNFLIYNRALTSQEIQQNFNATRTRFGI